MRVVRNVLAMPGGQIDSESRTCVANQGRKAAVGYAVSIFSRNGPGHGPLKGVFEVGVGEVTQELGGGTRRGAKVNGQQGTDLHTAIWVRIRSIDSLIFFEFKTIHRRISYLYTAPIESSIFLHTWPKFTSYPPNNAPIPLPTPRPTAAARPPTPTPASAPRA